MPYLYLFYRSLNLHTSHPPERNLFKPNKRRFISTALIFDAFIEDYDEETNGIK